MKMMHSKCALTEQNEPTSCLVGTALSCRWTKGALPTNLPANTTSGGSFSLDLGGGAYVVPYPFACTESGVTTWCLNCDKLRDAIAFSTAECHHNLWPMLLMIQLRAFQKKCCILAQASGNLLSLLKAKAVSFIVCVHFESEYSTLLTNLPSYAGMVARCHPLDLPRRAVRTLTHGERRSVMLSG